MAAVLDPRNYRSKLIPYNDSEPTVKKAHPLFYRLVLIKAGINFSIALFLFTGDYERIINYKVPPSEQVLPLWFWGVLWTAIGCVLIYGLLRRSSRQWLRWGLIAAACVGGFWATGFWLNFFAGRILGISAPILWTAYTLKAIALSSEPRLNPLAALLESAKQAGQSGDDGGS